MAILASVVTTKSFSREIDTRAEMSPGMVEIWTERYRPSVVESTMIEIGTEKFAHAR